MRTAGYNPDLVVASPADALAIQLLEMTGGDSFAFNQQLPSFVITPAVEDGFVCDANALGTTASLRCQYLERERRRPRGHRAGRGVGGSV